MAQGATLAPTASAFRPVRRGLDALVLTGALVGALGSGAVLAQPTGAKPQTAGAPARAEQGLTWSALSPGQRAALAPLQGEWPRIEGPSKLKWLEVAARLPGLDARERERVQIRMAEWVRLSPAERGRARLQFQETRQLSSSDRKERWQAYQELAPDQRQALAAKASPAGVPVATAVAPAAAAAVARAPTTGLAARVEPGNTAPARALLSRPAQIQPQEPGFAQDFDASGGRKRNLIGPAAAPLTPAQAIGPTVLQARPGATTSLMTRPIEPPAHHQAGLPKIAASRGFVDPATLLPQRGPQGAAVVRPAPPAAAPARAPRETQ